MSSEMWAWCDWEPRWQEGNAVSGFTTNRAATKLYLRLQPNILCELMPVHGNLAIRCYRQNRLSNLLIHTCKDTAHTSQYRTSLTVNNIFKTLKCWAVFGVGSNLQAVQRALFLHLEVKNRRSPAHLKVTNPHTKTVGGRETEACEGRVYAREKTKLC